VGPRYGAKPTPKRSAFPAAHPLPLPSPIPFHPFPAQLAYRQRLFDANIARIDEHNRNIGPHGWKMSPNAFADLEHDEWRSHVSYSKWDGGHADEEKTARVTGKTARDSSPESRSSLPRQFISRSSPPCPPLCLPLLQFVRGYVRDQSDLDAEAGVDGEETISAPTGWAQDGASARGDKSRKQLRRAEGSGEDAQRAPIWGWVTGWPWTVGGQGKGEGKGKASPSPSPSRAPSPSSRPPSATSASPVASATFATSTASAPPPAASNEPSAASSSASLSPSPLSSSSSSSSSPPAPADATPSSSPSAAARPVSVDWSAPSLGAVNSIQTQGDCGACFAFATAAALESATKISTGVLPSLSEQQVLDCGAGTCADGSGIRAAWRTIQSTGGLCARDAYPYRGAKGTCASESCGAKLSTVSGYRNVERGSQAALEYVVSLQPVVVPIQADEDSFRFYSGGVLDAPCGTTLNHAVVVVGYGVEPASGKAYWKLRNSWGPGWGEDGYIRIARGEAYNPDGLCGVQMDPTVPKVAVPGVL
jgi:C1A family cysteine protease